MSKLGQKYGGLKFKNVNKSPQGHCTKGILKLYLNTAKTSDVVYQ